MFKALLDSLATVRKAAPLFQPVPSWLSGRAQLQPLNYQTFAREGYAGNEYVFACLEELSTSAAEPGMMVRMGEEWSHSHPVLDLLARPNPFMDRFEMWATVIMHRGIAGNAYALKVRSGAGRVVQLWLLRPDRVRIVPDAQKYIARYDYELGAGETYALPVEDVIHWRTRNPLDDFYGMPPLMALSGRVDIDNFMRHFVKAFFENAGVPAGMLSIKQKLREEQRQELRTRFRSEFGGPSGWHDLLILDNADASFTPLTQQLGQRGLVLPELDEINESRICAVFGVPQSLVGTRISYQNGGYANKRAEQQDFWTGTLAPLYKELAGRLNLSLAPEYPGVAEIAFDMHDVRALQPDADALSARLLKEVDGGIRTIEEARSELGLPAEPSGTLLVPANLIPTPAGSLPDENTPPAPVAPAPTVAGRNGHAPP